MRKILLVPAEFVVADNLSYEQACQAMELANKHPVGSVYKFFLSNNKNGKWALVARDISWAKDFVDNVEKYIIEIADETKEPI